MINFGNISIVDLRLGATQVGAAYLGNKQVWSLGPVVPKYDIKSIGRSTSKQGTSIYITEQAGETITLYIKTNATDLTNKQVCAAVYLNSTDVTPYASFAFSNVSLTGRYITGTTPDVSTWVPSGFPETYSTLYMKTWIQDAGYIDPADALGEVLDWTGEEYNPLIEPVCFTLVSDPTTRNTIALLKTSGSGGDISIETSRDSITWNDYAIGTNIELNSTTPKLYFRAKNENQTICSNNVTYQFRQTGSYGIPEVAASGNIQTLLKADGSRTDAPAYCYTHLFDNFINLQTAPSLFATSVGERCYDSMFNLCTQLQTAPIISATTLGNYSCYMMFSTCRALTTAPVLPATTLAEGCYQYMFNQCSSLTTAPVLPATTLASSCYQYMFSQCSSLTTAPVLPATTLASSCYQSMFSSCSSLTIAPALPATTLVSGCYAFMFYDCTSLNSVEVAFTSWPEILTTNQWVKGVAATGTFTCPAALGTDSTITRDNGKCPTGWTVVNV